ncbi:MAG: C25 family cysteine peptidase [Peptococcaceae bacterium]|nr:C25 family cysteine peptidase [Peptococcaceae bacterium]
MKYHDNVIALTSKIEGVKISAGSFEIKNFKITEGQDKYNKIFVGRRFYLENGKFTFSIGRKKSSAVATWFHHTQALINKNTFSETAHSVDNMNFALIGKLEFTIGQIRYTFDDVAIAQDSRYIKGVSRNYWLLGGKNGRPLGSFRLSCSGTDSLGQNCTIVFELDVYNNSVNVAHILSLSTVAPPTPKALLIITPAQFRAALEPLKKHKEATGITTHILSLEAIYEIFLGRDEAEKVKICIADYHKNRAIGHVLLVGDSDVFPVRYTTTDRAGEDACNTAFCPTDLYYAALYKENGDFDNWDWNNNGYYGELYGETHAGEINIDKVSLTPVVAVGRVPASTLEGVNRFVQKVIRYEIRARNSAWPKRALLMATHDWRVDAYTIIDRVQKDSLPDYDCIMLATSGAGAGCGYIGSLNAAKITETFNKGIGLVGYVGHGDTGALAIPNSWWGIGDLSNLHNEDKLPIMVAAACSTAAFATLPPYCAYVDINGLDHVGTGQGEVFYSSPPQPACLQSKYNPNNDLGTHITVSTDAGAVAYFGGNTGMQGYMMDLLEYFFQCLPSCHTLGEAWQGMVLTYYKKQGLPGSLIAPNWVAVAQVHQPWKCMFFGDPTLRIGGEPDSLLVCCIMETGAHYNTVHDAIGDVPEGSSRTIVLLKHITQNKEINVLNKTIILDLNGKNLSVESRSYGIHVENGHVKLADPANGEFNVTGLQGYGVFAGNNSTVEVTNATGTLGGVNVVGGSSVTVYDTITAFSEAIYIMLGDNTQKTQAHCEFMTTKLGFATYSDGINTVWANLNARGNTYVVNAMAYESPRWGLHHEMHRITCPRPPSHRNQIPAGRHSCPENAIRYVREEQLVERAISAAEAVVDGCYICCREISQM